MFRTKKDVDRHSQEVLKKLKNEKDRNLRCLSLAQQYYNVHDYESAKRFVLMYLSVKDDSPVAHKLLAQCHEQFNEKDKALQEYFISLQVDPKQPELILRVCDLLGDDDVVDKSQSKYWQEIGEKHFPYHPTILKLKKKLYLMEESGYTKNVEASLTRELKNEPDDPVLHAQLLTFYIDNGRVKDAYEEAFGKVLKFTPTIQWYQCAVKICKTYKLQYPNAIREEFYANYSLSLERLLALAVQDVKISRKSITECISFLAKLDEILSDANSLINQSVKFQQILSHMCGQLCFHSASILCRKLKWEDNNSQDANHQLIYPLLLLSTSKDFKIFDSVAANDNLSRILNICVSHNAYRILQTGLVLQNLAKESNQFIEKIFHLCVANYWKERIIDKIYSTSDYKSFRKNSFFMNYAGFSNLPSELPTHLLENMERNINIIEAVNVVSLHHIVWLGINYVELSGKKSLLDMSLSYQFFSRKVASLPFSNSSSSSYAEGLCRLDVDSFLYACVFCAKSYIDQQTSSDQQNRILLADVSKPLGTPEQEQWWEYVHQMASNSITENCIPRVRSCLQKGIEEVRLLGNHVLPLPVLVLLGRTFSNRAAVEPDSERATVLEERALLYWKTALPLLEKITRGEIVNAVTKSMFEYQRNIIPKIEAVKLIEEGKRIVGMNLMKEGDYSESLSIGENVNESYGDFNTSTPSNFALNAWVEKLTQTITEQNLKVMDKLETLFNKQELLCSNQFQLFEQISNLTKKVEDFMLLDCDEYLDRLQLTQSLPQSQNTVTSQSNFPFPSNPPNSLVTNIPNLVSPKIQTNFPMSSFTTPFNSNLNNGFSVSPFPNTYGIANPATSVSIPSIFLNHPQLPTVPLDLGNFGNFKDLKPHTDTPILSSLPLKIEPEYGVNRIPDVPTYSASHSISTPSFMNTSNMSQIPFMPAYSSPQSTYDFSPKQPAVHVTSSSFSSNISSKPFSGFSKTNTSPAISPNLLTTPVKSPQAMNAWKAETTPTHPFQIPTPETSVILPPPSVEVPEDDDDDDHQPFEYDPIPDFKPIIPLPDMVDVKTGEENEIVLYENRVKLFRFIDKEWKERGIGNYKLLKNKETGRVRALMRRETVHKVCANHFLSEDMTLSPMISSDRAWVYSAPDYADEQVQIEKFCIKFKTPEESKKFYDVFNKYKTENAKISTSQSSTSEKTVSSSSVTKVGTYQIVSSASGSITVEKQKKTIIAPPTINADKEKESITSPFKFGNIQSSFSDSGLFTDGVKAEDKSAANAESSKTSFSSFAPSTPQPVSAFGVKTEDKSENKPESNKTPFGNFTGFTLSASSQSNAFSKLFQSQIEKNETKAVDLSPLFGTAANAPDFSTLSGGASETPSFPKSKNFKGFQGAGSLVFGSLADKSKADSVSSSVAAILKNVEKISTPEKKADNDGTLNESVATDTDEFVPTQEFVPVIPLPDVVEIKTGEEGLHVLYEDRCKLFRYVGEEWKERGVGNMKILRDPKDESIRMLMRREQVYKLCCNQRVTLEHELKPLKTSDKAWTWYAQDFSEGELKSETFCVRFKNSELANVFKKAFDDAKATLSTSAQKTPTKEATPEKPLPKLSELFKPAAGSWECKMCYVSNKKENDTCVSCTSPRDPDAPKPASTISSFGSAVSSTKEKFSFGIPPTDKKTESNVKEPFSGFVVPTSSSSFGSSSDAKWQMPNFTSFGSISAEKSQNIPLAGISPAKTESTAFKFSGCSISSKDSAKSTESATFTFGDATDSKKTDSFNFSLNAPTFNFGSSSNTSTLFQNDTNKNDGQQNSASGFNFQPNKPEENALIFGAASSPFGINKSVSIFGSGGILETTLGKNSSNESSALNKFSFKLDTNRQAFSPLQERVPVLINDKNEITLFKVSAMLSTFVNSKEEQRNGVVLILSNPKSKKVRLLMKREPSQFALFNHFLDKNIVFKKLDDYSWQWMASDFSKGEIFEENFQLTFYSIETADEFKSVLDKVQREMKEGSNDSPTSEVEFVSAIEATEEEKKLAESLQLPSNYFNYKYKKDCKGCNGCEEEDRKKRQDDKENLTKKSPLVVSNTPVKSSLSENSGLFNFSKPVTVLGDITNDAESVKNSPQKTDKESEDEEEVVKNDHDPHFDPIVPLPKEIEVKTGEEDEEIKFCKRAKLFRYDNNLKEWKERGVGDLKILYHPVNKTYRFLMRREQVHKVVLNQRISPDLSLKTLLNNSKSWCWVGPNLPEEQSQPILESLAVRFKTDEISEEFSKVVESCLNDIGSEKIENENQEDYEDEENEYDDDNEYEYQEDDLENYVDEKGIGEAMEENDLDGVMETVFLKAANVLVMEKGNAIRLEGVVRLVKKFDESSVNGIGGLIFSTEEIPDFCNINITEEMAVIVQEENVVFCEGDDEKLEISFDNVEDAAEFESIFINLQLNE